MLQLLTKPKTQTSPLEVHSTYLPEVDCDRPPVFSKSAVLGLFQCGWQGLWQGLFCRGDTAILGDVLQGEERSGVGTGVLALCPLTSSPQAMRPAKNSLQVF